MITLASIVDTVIPWCLLALAIAIGAALVRLLRGPTGADRVMALDLVTVVAAGFIGILAIADDEPDYLTVALVISLISFLAAVALALYVEREGSGGDRHEL